MLYCAFLFMLLIFTVGCTYGQDDPVANERCFGCRIQRNPKDLYAHPTNCHKYYQCFYTGVELKAIGFERDCPKGSFWNEIILTCVPEGNKPCEDKCRSHEINAKGCYADENNCASYFVCSQWTSYPFCCPSKTAFNPETCQCDESDTCKDKCERKPVDPPTTTESAQVFDNFCIDSWSNKIFPDEDADFFNLEADDGSLNRIKCASGSKFSIDKCSCSVNVDLPKQSKFRQCTFYLPFEEDRHDHSVHNYQIDIIPPAKVTSEAAARGNGSLRTGNGGFAELPFKKGTAYNPQSLSFCRFFRCINPPCTYSSGALFSYRSSPDPNELHGGVTSFQPGNIVRGEHVCLPAGLFKAEVTLPQLPSNAPNGFYQMCTVGGEKRRRLYINKELIVDEESSDCVSTPPLTCPVMLGYDPVYGSFEGYIDEVLECPYDIGEEGVIAHWNGKEALQALGMVP